MINEPVIGTVPRGEDLTLKWQRGTPGLYITVDASATQPKRQSFSCLFDSQSGQATIPRTMLEGLGTDGSAYVGAITLQYTRAGAFPIELAVVTSVHYSADRLAVGRMSIK